MNNNILIFFGVLILVIFLCKNSIEGFNPYYNNFDFLNRSVFSLDERIDKVPDPLFLNYFEEGRKVTCPGGDKGLSDSLRSEYCFVRNKDE